MGRLSGHSRGVARTAAVAWLVEVAGVAPLASAQPVWPPPYAAIELDAPPELGVTPFGINRFGAMTGRLNGSPNISFAWHNGRARFIDAIKPDYTADANDINDSGWIVGMSGDFAGNFVPTLWVDGSPISLGTLGGSRGEAFAISQNGLVVGQAANEKGHLRAFGWTDGRMFDLGTLGGLGGKALGCNDFGQVVGQSFRTDPPREGPFGFLWDNGEMTDLGTIPGGTSSVALDINDRRQIVGHADNGGPDDEPMFWEDGVMRSMQNFELGDSGYANRINNLGQAVGFTQFEATAKPRTFIWDDTEGMRLIEDLIPPRHGLKIRIGRDINDHGQIAVEASRGNPFTNGEFVGLLVTPVHPTMLLEAPSPGIAGVENTLTVTNATPGAPVRFFYSLRGGGEFIPGCATRLNALQLANPTFIGAAIADGNGTASITAMAPAFAQGRTVLFQAVVQGECAISELVRHEFE